MRRIIYLAVILGLWIVPVSAFSAGEERSAEQKEPLQERQQFNKLRRSTKNIYKVTMRSSVAYRLQTALGYVSTIDLPEPALKVFAGDQELFKVEVYEKQVLVKPITDEADARTNLIIVTGSGRLAFDVSVGPPETADFVLDFRLPQDDEALVKNAFEMKVEEKVAPLRKAFEEKEKKLDETAQKLSEGKLREKVAEGVGTIDLKASESQGEVQVNLLSLSRVADKAYLRFSVLNYSKTPYRVLKVAAGAIEYDRRLLKKTESGSIEFPAELELSRVIQPDSYVYGVIVFDYRVLGKNQKPILRVLEDVPEHGAARNIEIKGFRWFE